MSAPKRLGVVPATIGGMLVGAMLASCASAPGTQAVALDRPAVQFSQGRLTLVLLDEYGTGLPGMRVDVSWQEPSFYQTSALTNWAGKVTFSGVPQLAEVTIDHPGGTYQDTFQVPQSGAPEFRVMVDTLGEGHQMRERERQLFAPPSSQAQ
jgi:hypothetical protein